MTALREHHARTEEASPSVGAIILARLDSSRLPGKALRLVHGQEMLRYTIERARMVRHVSNIVLATSDRLIDDPLAAFARDCGINVFRGSVSDVAGRVASCITEYRWDAAIRINGDSPFIDPDTISRGVELLLGMDSPPLDSKSLWQGTLEHAGHRDHPEAQPEIVTNVLRRSFPKGLSVEVFRTDTFLRGYTNMSRPEHFEHVTKYFYDTRSVPIVNMVSRDDTLGEIQLSVDTPEDSILFERMLAHMDKPHTMYSDYQILDLYRKCIHG